MTPIHENAREERDERIREMVAQNIHQNVPTVNTAIEILSKTDPIIKHVWEHYTVKRQTTPLNPHDVKYFWEKVTECFANLNDFKKPLRNTDD
jgi:hypothetical protein